VRTKICPTAPLQKKCYFLTTVFKSEQAVREELLSRASPANAVF